MILSCEFCCRILGIDDLPSYPKQKKGHFSKLNLKLIVDHLQINSRDFFGCYFDQRLRCCVKNAVVLILSKSDDSVNLAEETFTTGDKQTRRSFDASNCKFSLPHF